MDAPQASASEPLGAHAASGTRGASARPAWTQAVDPGIAASLVLFALIACVPFLATVWGGSYLISLVTKAAVLAIAVVSLDLLIGRAGLVSFGHAAFLGLGAYVTGIGLQEGIEDAVTLLTLVVVASALFALVTGALSLRTTGVYFIMITLAFSQMLFFGFSSLAAYGGDDGLTLWSLSTVFGTDVLQTELGKFYVILAVLVAAWAFVNAVAASRFGRVLRAAKEAPVRVETLGYSVYTYRLVAYVIAGVIAGIAGFLMAHHAEFVSPAISTWQRSGDLIIMVVLGGMATRTGPILGALFLVLVEEALSTLVTDWRLIFGPLLVLIVLYARGGLARLPNVITALRSRRASS
ncbi:MAG: branched-chain amino acid ABC transporter permease [Pseudomonadota bacterium]